MPVGRMVQQSDTRKGCQMPAHQFLPDIAAAKHIPQQIRMEIMVLLHGQRAVLELQPVVIYACTYPRGKPLAEGKAVRGFQPPKQVFATERRAEKGCRTSGDTDKPIAVSPCRNDRLKGYKTNTDLSPEKVYEAYQNLWNVERSFRITKGTLDVRPMFHFTPRRIEAHVCICFVALKVYKELERLLKLSGCPYSVDETLKIAETIVTIEIARPENKDTITKTLCLTEEERAIAYLIDTHDWLEL